MAATYNYYVLIHPLIMGYSQKALCLGPWIHYFNELVSDIATDTVQNLWFDRDVWELADCYQPVTVSTKVPFGVGLG